MSVGKRLSTDEPLTEHDVAERLSKALLRVWRIAEEVTADPMLHRAVLSSRYLAVSLPNVLDALSRLRQDPVCEHDWITEGDSKRCTRCGKWDYDRTAEPDDRESYDYRCVPHEERDGKCSRDGLAWPCPAAILGPPPKADS